MMTIEPNSRAALVESIHPPWRATVGECIARWSMLDRPIREQSYLVVQQGADRQHTLNAGRIAELAIRFG